MLQNYLKIAWRNIRNNKLFSFLNIFGLATGLSCCMLITLYIARETSYDLYHQNADRLYELATTFVKDGKDNPMPNTPAPMAAAMKQEFPEIEETTRILQLFSEDKTLLQYKPDNKEIKSFYETKGFAADSTFFRLFTYEFIEGNPRTCLDAPNTVVINEEIAKKLFGNEPALDKIIKISSNTNGDTSFTITGVFRPLKKPTQIDARFFISMKGGGIEQFIKSQTDMAGNNMFQTFLLLKPGANAMALEAKFPAFVDKHIGAVLKSIGFYKKQFLIPLKDMHLYPGMSTNISSVGSRASLYILGSIALFTLLLACINFMNLSTARSSKRSSEVGIRKVLGAEKHSLIKQFVGESILLSFIALAFAFGIALLTLQFFSYISGTTLTIDLSSQWPLLLGFLIIAVITGLLAGSYPAFYLSSFIPVKVLKGGFTSSLSAIALRKGLVVFQFIISVALIIASVVINKQMHYMRTKDLGFQKDQQIIIPMRSSNAKNIYIPLKNEIKKNPEVEIKTIGKTTEGRPLEIVRIGNPNAPYQIFLRARAHGFEVGGNWVVQGLIRSLLEKGGAQYLNRYCLYIFPMANKDAVALGRTRFNGQGMDLNRNWDKPANPELCPENYAVENWIKQMIAKGKKPDLAIDLHNDREGNLHFSHPISNGNEYLLNTERFESLLYKHTWFTEGRKKAEFRNPGTIGEGLLERYGITAFIYELNFEWSEGLKKVPTGKDWELLGKQLQEVFFQYFKGTK